MQKEKTFTGEWAQIFTVRLEELGISQYRLSKDLQIPLSTIQNYCNGKTRPDLTRGNKICNYLGIQL